MIIKDSLYSLYIGGDSRCSIYSIDYPELLYELCTDSQNLRNFISSVRQQLCQLRPEHHLLHRPLLRLLTDKTPEEVDELPVPPPDRDLSVGNVLVLGGVGGAGQGGAGLVQVGDVTADLTVRPPGAERRVRAGPGGGLGGDGRCRRGVKGILQI